jgi:divalent metal cation (Fe/Co/Zn/Cd) transporter
VPTLGENCPIFLDLTPRTVELRLTLALYIVVDATRRLLGAAAQPHASVMGVAVTVAALVVMPLLGRAKLRTASALNSGGLRADAFESTACAWLAATALMGLALNALLGWWWADPVAALLLVPLICREALEGLAT